jgi:hypothetical protein
MSGNSGFYDRREWLLMIGRRLRAEYEAVNAPVPERLAALVKQLEAGSASTDACLANFPRVPGDGQQQPAEARATDRTRARSEIVADRPLIFRKYLTERARSR